MCPILKPKFISALTKIAYFKMLFVIFIFYSYIKASNKSFCQTTSERSQEDNQVMAAILNGQYANSITVSKNAEIFQDDENGERIIAEAKWYLPGFKNRQSYSVWLKVYIIVVLTILTILTLFILLPLAIICIILFFCVKKQEPIFSQRLYLTESSIVYKIVGNRGLNNNLAYHRDFRINLANILHIKSIGHERYLASEGRIEARAHDVVVFQLKEDSTQEIQFGGNPGTLSCCFDATKDVDSFAFMCHNGEEFVQAVKEQMIALNITN